MEQSLQYIPLSEIGDTIGTPPAERLRASVERMGVVQPIILSRQADDSGEIRLTVVDGNRRIAAARSANLDSVPAIVFDGLEPNTIAETTLATNSFRSANYLAEFWALKHLERNQYRYDDIIAASGMASSTIRLRNSLSNLHRELFVALRNGQINQSVAIATAKLTPQQQELLAKRFHRYGNLTRRDIQVVAPSDKTGSPSGNEVADQLASAATEASKLGYSKAEYLEMAARIWDESVNQPETNTNQSREEDIMREHTPNDQFPDLAAHKWDTSET